MTPCGCRIGSLFNPHGGPSGPQTPWIVFCALHQAAEQMREALTQLAQAYCLEFGCENWQTASPDYVQHALAASEEKGTAC